MSNKKLSVAQVHLLLQMKEKKEGIVEWGQGWFQFEKHHGNVSTQTAKSLIKAGVLVKDENNIYHPMSELPE